MKYKELIEHILGNSYAYIEEYSKKDKLSDIEKGVLLGLLMDIDSIKNQLEMEELKIDIDLEEIMSQLNKLIGE